MRTLLLLWFCAFPKFVCIMTTKTNYFIFNVKLLNCIRSEIHYNVKYFKFNTMSFQNILWLYLFDFKKWIIIGINPTDFCLKHVMSQIWNRHQLFTNSFFTNGDNTLTSLTSFFLVHVQENLELKMRQMNLEQESTFKKSDFTEWCLNTLSAAVLVKLS